MCGLPHVNFRFFMFAALSLCAGMSLYLAVRLNRFTFFDFIPFILIFLFAFVPLSPKRLLSVAAVVLCFSSLGAALVHLSCVSYLSGVPEGEYEVECRVETFSQGDGYSYCTVKSLSFNGTPSDGKMIISFSGEGIRAGDIVSFTASVMRYDLPAGKQNPSHFSKDIRYHALVDEYEIKGQRGALLILNAKIYDILNEGMERDEAAVGYALLTGNSAAMDEGLLSVSRQGGIAHIFAVSGLHVGIVYSAVYFALKKPLKRYAALPSLAFAFGYSALCAFTVSSVRALIMCAVLGFVKIAGRKPDIMTSVSIAAAISLMIMPSQYISVGFTLSYGACIGLALFSHSFTRAFRKIKLPAFLANYLGAALSVQLFTFPILLDTFGYASVWSLLLNFILLPCLPVLLIALILCTIFALATTLSGVLVVPAGMISLLLFVLSAADTSFVIAGFSLGAGSAVIVTLCVVLTQRFRLHFPIKAVASTVLCLLFAAVVILKNCVFTGCKLTVGRYETGSCVLIQTKNEAALVIDGTIDLDDCTDFLNRHYGRKLDAVIVSSFDELAALNRAAFLGTEVVYARDEIATGLRETVVVFGDEIEIGEMYFRYETRSKIVLVAEGTVTEFDFSNPSSLGADLFFGGGEDGEFYVKNGAVYKIWI